MEATLEHPARTGRKPVTKEQAADEVREFARLNREEECLLSFVQAGLLLGVSKQRVTQLVEAGHLKTYRFFGREYLSCKEVTARRQTDLKNGRPKRSLAQRAAVAARLMVTQDRHQWRAEIKKPL